MATYVLIHGAGDVAWSWHFVADELRGRGHGVVAVDLPSEDESASFADYADVVVEAIGERTGLILVAHSLGGFVAPLVAMRVLVDMIVLVAGMVPVPGESADEWWTNTGYAEMRRRRGREDDEVQLFMHDVPRALAEKALAKGRSQAGAPMREPWPLPAWPDVPTRYLLCRDDRMFPAEWLREVVRERLGLDPDEMDGGHSPYLSRPSELAERLDAYLAASPAPPPRPRRGPS